jgi:DNA mismatch endonuclease (patch repair protein)
MADWLPENVRSRIMRAIRDKNTKPELTVRKSLFARGYRYRLHSKKLPGRPDLVFPGRKKVVFVHGCFWHQHSDPSCPICGVPASNQSYWEPKLRRNIERDCETTDLLKDLGWGVHIIWECQIRRNAERAFSQICKFLGPPANSPLKIESRRDRKGR